MNMLRSILTLVVAGMALVGLGASGPVGIYAVVEKVVFEPNEQTPERVQVWGAFAYSDGSPTATAVASPVRRGYLYFKLPDPGGATGATSAVREWRDLKAVAGTGQVVGFGTWMYIGAFGGLDPSVKRQQPPYILETSPGRGWSTDMRVRAASEAPSAPAGYQSEGVVKIPAEGSRAELVARLRDALKP